MTPKEAIASNISRAMLRSGMRNAELARMTGLTKTAVGYYVAGKCEPKASHLKRLCEALGCSADDILEGV